VQLRLLARGANGRVYRLEGEALVAKVYSPAPPGRPDRRLAEWSALRFLRGVPGVPEALATEGDLTLLSLLPGRRLQPHEVGEREVLAAVEFLLALQALRPRAASLPPAADAGFSVAQHLENVRRRFAMLEESLQDPEAADFLRHRLGPLLERVGEGLRQAGDERPVPPEHRILSPSDFGFHNILRAEDGRLSFVDFEYFGWDDAAKTAADFRHQPEAELSEACFSVFRRRLVEGLGGDAALDRRIGRLLPLQGLKWILIMLNAFRPGATPPPEGRPARLERARARLAGMESEGI
jgi:hypothetical protein